MHPRFTTSPEMMVKNLFIRKQKQPGCFEKFLNLTSPIRMVFRGMMVKTGTHCAKSRQRGGDRMMKSVQKKGLMIVTSFLVIVSFLVSGCAAIFHGTTERIYVRSDEPDTRFFMNEREIGKGTSASTAINKKELKQAVLRGEKAGCDVKSSPILTAFDATTLLGILIDWGIISILVVDWAATGAITKAAQTDYVLTPECPKQQPQQQLM
jgi:hypothetical protein